MLFTTNLLYLSRQKYYVTDAIRTTQNHSWCCKTTDT